MRDGVNGACAQMPDSAGILGVPDPAALRNGEIASVPSREPISLCEKEAA